MKTKSVFVCIDCGNESAKWSGRCPACGAWNTMKEQSIQIKKPARSIQDKRPRGEILPINEINSEDEIRFTTGMNELDRVLGGGAVRGSLVLVGGEPGIGKSTILLQICKSICADNVVLYISGEESQRQLKMRAQRLGVISDKLYTYAETNMEDILEAVTRLNPDILIIDSIQTVYMSEIDSPPGSVAQVKESTLNLMSLAKGSGITVFVVGHVNKEGMIAGPKVLEHMVDCVLYFEGDRNMTYRILRAAKNRYGSTNEIGVFEMHDNGLVEIGNPSAALLSGRPENVPGTCVACVMEGSRPLLAEIQALIAPSGFGTPRRMSAGVDYNRAMLLLAVLEKRAGFKIGMFDAYINVIGGLKLIEPAADLPCALAVASSCRDIPISPEVAAFGEIGLTGELRSVSGTAQRLAEIHRLGFKKCVIPVQNARDIKIPNGLEVLFAKNINDAIAKAI
jgi:DNA repair protein RadA/Sms